MTEGLRSIRPLTAESLRGIEPAEIVGKPPKFEWVDPKTLYVEEAYQRQIGEAGVGLVRKIYSGFAWARMKPPVCVRLPESGNVLVCIDGQHTATAAASHPGIEKIPVMVVDAAAASLRAGAFVGHNRDRIALTAQAIYRAELAAGDEIACVIDRACRAAGANVPRKSISTGDRHPVGTTIALGALKAIAKRQGEEALTRILRLAVRAERGPIRSDEIAALAVVTNFAAVEADDRIVDLMASKTDVQWIAEAHVCAVESGTTGAAELAKLWLRALSISEDRVPSSKTARSTAIIAAVSPMKPGIAPARKAPTPLKEPPAALPQQGKPLDPNRFIQRNGVTVDMYDDVVTNRGFTVKMDPDATPVVCALTRIMPSVMDFSRLAKSAFGSSGSDPAGKIKRIADEANVALEGARLQIRIIPKMGFMLADLGPP